MPRRSTQEYAFIKTYAEVHYGVMTQCVLQKNVERANPQLINNLLQKVNTKMGGVNTKVSCKFKRITSKTWRIIQPKINSEKSSVSRLWLLDCPSVMQVLAVICHRLYQQHSHVILLQPNTAALEKPKRKVLASLLTWRISWLRVSKHSMVAPR